MVMEVDYTMELSDDDDKELPVIRLYGCDRDGGSVVVFMNGFRPYFYVRLDSPPPMLPSATNNLRDLAWTACYEGIRTGRITQDHITEIGRRLLNEHSMRLSSDLCQSVKERLNQESKRPSFGGGRKKKRARTDQDTVERVDLVFGYRTIYGYTEKAQLFFRIQLLSPPKVPGIRTLIQGNRILSGGEYGSAVQTFESNVEFVIRYMIDSGLVGCGWLELLRRTYDVVGSDGGKTWQDLEIQVRDWTRAVTHRPSEGKKWSVIAPIQIMSFDIECTTPRSGMFPNPTNSGDKVIQIANYVHRVGDPQDQFLQTNIFNLKTCDPVEDAEVYAFDSERDLLKYWSRFVKQVNADIFTGYNIVGFDLFYLIKRAIALKIEKDFAFLGRIRESKSVLVPWSFYSKAHGRSQKMRTRIYGRIPMDAYELVTRDNACKYRSYTLRNVAQQILGRTKKDVSYTEIPGLHNGTDAQRKRLAVYCKEDALLPLEILWKQIYLFRQVEMARVCGIPIQMLLTKGQQIKVFAQILRLNHDQQNGYLIPYRVQESTPKKKTNDRTADYKGAIVLRPMKGFYDKNPIATIDFSSLYPSIVIGFNLCYSTLLTKEQAEAMDLADIRKTPSGQYFVKEHVRKGILPRILTNVLRARSVAKADMKRAEEEGDDEKEKIQDGRQRALKITANSTYGFTGARVGKLPCIEIAQSVTAYGRCMLELTKAIVEACRFYDASNEMSDDDDDDALLWKQIDCGEVDPRQYSHQELQRISRHGIIVVPPKSWVRDRRGIAGDDLEAMTEQLRKEKQQSYVVIYGDTDSTMIKMREDQSIAKCIAAGRKLAAIVTAYFYLAVTMAFEKIYTRYILIKRKKYAGLYWTKPKKPDFVDVKGLESKRRDWPLFVSRLFQEVLNKIMGWNPRKKEVIDPDVPGAIRLVQECQTKILLHQLPMSDFVTTKKYTKPAEEYASKQAHVELVKRMAERDPATAPKLGERVEFVYVEGTKKSRAYERVEDPVYAEKNKISADANYYIHHGLVKPFLRLFRHILAPGKGRKEAFRRVYSMIFCGEHARVRRIITPANKTGIMRWVQVGRPRDEMISSDDDDLEWPSSSDDEMFLGRN